MSVVSQDHKKYDFGDRDKDIDILCHKWSQKQFIKADIAINYVLIWDFHEHAFINLSETLRGVAQQHPVHDWNCRRPIWPPIISKV